MLSAIYDSVQVFWTSINWSRLRNEPTRGRSSTLTSPRYSSINSSLRRRQKLLPEIDRSGTTVTDLFRKLFSHYTILKIPSPDYVDKKGNTSQITSTTTNHTESRLDLPRHRRTQALVPSPWQAPSPVPHLSQTPRHPSLGAQSYPAHSSRRVPVVIPTIPPPPHPQRP